MEKIITLKEELKKISSFIESFENKNLSKIDKDILLQKIRDLYLGVIDLDEKTVSDFKPQAGSGVQFPITEKPQAVSFEKQPESVIAKPEPTISTPEPVIAKPEPINVISEKEEMLVEFADSFNSEPEQVITPVVVAETKPIPEPVIIKQEPQVKKPIVEQANLFAGGHNGGVKTIGEQLGQNKTSLNEMLGQKNHMDDVATRLKPLTDIKAAIGVGDRFLYIRELFGGNTDSFDSTISHLNSLNSFQDAHNYLASNFKWDESQSTVSTFINIVKRRYV